MGFLKKNVLSKELKEVLKTLSFLARAEKYYDLELNKNGKMTKPLLQIIDVIEPLRQIVEATVKLEKGKTDIDPNAKYSFARIDEITELSKDILRLNPRVLVSSDKAILIRVGDYLLEAKMLFAGARTQFEDQPPQQAQPQNTYQPQNFGQRQAQPQPAYQPQHNQFAPQAPAQQSPFAYNPAPQQQVVQPPQQPAQPQAPQYAQPAASNYNSPFGSPFAQNQIPPFPEPQPIQQQPQQPAYEPAPSFASQDYGQPEQEPQPIQPKTKAKSRAVVSNEIEDVEFEIEEPKVISITKSKKEKYGSKASEKAANAKYFATSYAGMNLQEAADIIGSLASSKQNLNLVLIEHASEVRPVALGKEIIDDLRALAPIADALESGNEVENRRSVAILKDADRMATICRDIASLSIEGFDKRKQKLLERFVPYDILQLAQLARTAYPDVFNATDVTGEAIASYLYDVADLLQDNSDELDDELFARALAQVVVQVAQYAEINQIKSKFDIITKRNKLIGKAKPLEKRHELAILRAMTFIPQIARQVQELEGSQNISIENRELIEKTLELLQLAYLHARENYTAVIGEFLNRHAA